ncbi:MAG: nitroreductase family protein [Bacteroidales bacterium]|nr:nitroreductase family protein [Bacteroidales bacterium]MCF8390583.1 nitroreductase family protein [Bacteroidales bacterium]
MIDTIFNHRSVRKYKSDSIPSAILDKILEAGSRASTTGNMQVYSVIVSSDQAQKEKLWEAHFKQDMVLSAPVHLTFCADFNRFSEWCNQREAEPGYDNFLSFITAAIDAILASQNVILEAEAHGLGGCYLGTATYNADKIIEILDLPKLVVPVAAIVLGYPDENPPLTDRLPLEAVVHYEKYKSFTPKRINSIYRQREESTETKSLLEINRKKTLAQIFTENRYTKENNEFFSKKYLDVIRKQGFGFPE